MSASVSSRRIADNDGTGTSMALAHSVNSVADRRIWEGITEKDEATKKKTAMTAWQIDDSVNSNSIHVREHISLSGLTALHLRFLLLSLTTMKLMTKLLLLPPLPLPPPLPLVLF